MKEVGLRSKEKPLETAGNRLLQMGSDAFAKDAVPKAAGGVLFIDEAYQLNPRPGTEGERIVNELLSLLEDDRGTTTVILAGYKDKIMVRPSRRGEQRGRDRQGGCR